MSNQNQTYVIYAVELVDSRGTVMHSARMCAEDATSDEAFESLADVADKLLGCVLKYRGEGGYWRTLHRFSWNDALARAQPDDESDEIGNLVVQVLKEGEAPGSIGKLAGSAKNAHSEVDVADAADQTLEEINRLGRGLDPSGRQQLIRKMASRGLLIIGVFQLTELFPLLDTLSDLEIGKLDFEDLPSIMPKMISACLALPKATLSKLMLRAQADAGQIADGVWAERANDTEDKMAGLFPTVVRESSKAEKNNIEEWVLKPTECQADVSQIPDCVWAERANDTDDKMAGLFPTVVQESSKVEENNNEEWVLTPTECQADANQIADCVWAERENYTDDKMAGLFPTVVQESSKDEENNIEESVLPPTECQGHKAASDDEWEFVEATGL